MVDRTGEGESMKKTKVTIIDKSLEKKCYFCNGKGCKQCKSTGIDVQKFYHLIYTDKKGQKLCFGVDNLK